MNFLGLVRSIIGRLRGHEWCFEVRSKKGACRQLVVWILPRCVWQCQSRLPWLLSAVWLAIVGDGASWSCCSQGRFLKIVKVSRSGLSVHRWGTRHVSLFLFGLGLILGLRLCSCLHKRREKGQGSTKLGPRMHFSGLGHPCIVTTTWAQALVVPHWFVARTPCRLFELLRQDRQPGHRQPLHPTVFSNKTAKKQHFDQTAAGFRRSGRLRICFQAMHERSNAQRFENTRRN